MMEQYVGFWSLAVFSAELLALLWLLWKRTGIGFFSRWLARLSGILPLLLYLAYRIGDQVPDPATIRSFEAYLSFQTHLAVRDAEILAARYIPYLALAITTLAVLPRLTRCVKEFLDTPSGSTFNQPSGADPPNPSDPLGF